MLILYYMWFRQQICKIISIKSLKNCHSQKFIPSINLALYGRCFTIMVISTIKTEPQAILSQLCTFNVTWFSFQPVHPFHNLYLSTNNLWYTLCSILQQSKYTFPCLLGIWIPSYIKHAATVLMVSHLREVAQYNYICWICYRTYELYNYQLTNYKLIYNSLNLEKPSCLHTTPASLVDHPSSDTVPQVSLKQISTRPSLTLTVLPFLATSLTSPSLQKTVS